MQELYKFDFKINILPNRLLKYISFSLDNKLVFIKSFQFLSSSLYSLVKKLSKNDFKHLIQEFDSEVLDLVKKEGCYPYEYMCDFENFYEKLPSKKNFYSSLSDKGIRYKKYQHVFEVWNKFEMKTMKDYHDLYLKCDILLLADVFEKIRSRCLESYGLCPGHYLSASLLSWDKVELDLISDVDMYLFLDIISDVDMYLFLEKDLRLGASYIPKKYSKANNKYLTSYDPIKPKEYILYLKKKIMRLWFVKIRSNRRI